MNPNVASLIVFLSLATSAVVGLLVYERFPFRHRDAETTNVIRLVASIFVVMTSLVLGLMLNTAKNRFDAVNREVHEFATELILLDRNLRQYGAEADYARSRLKSYAELAATFRATGYDPLLATDPRSEDALDSFGGALRMLSPRDNDHLALWTRARQGYEKIVGIRWGLLQQAESSIPMPLLVMVTSWLTLVFASFGYGAPRNPVVVASLLLAAAVMAATVNLILELDAPFFGSIVVSPAPLQRALTEIGR